MICYYSSYIEYLSRLTSIKSVFSHIRDIQNVAIYCLLVLRENLPEWMIFQDLAGNIVAYNPSSTYNRCVYLSAHMDTVDAIDYEWKTSTFPFTALETESHLIGRGVNDCKAGVALILYISLLLRKGVYKDENLVFLISFREEGNIWKTSNFIGSRLGRSIPSSTSNDIICLENTVSVNQENLYFITAYNREPANYFISICNTLENIYSLMQCHPTWKPVCIAPVSETVKGKNKLLISEPARHVASLPNSHNVIYRFITTEKGGGYKLFSGDKNQLSTVQNTIEIEEAEQWLHHEITFNIRDFISKEDLIIQLQNMRYEEARPFRYANGSDRAAHKPTNFLAEKAVQLSVPELPVKVGANIGRSDASAFWNSISAELREKTGILVIGPGTRTHTYNGIVRATHGPDESFHKEAGLLAVRYLCRLIQHLQIEKGF